MNSLSERQKQIIKLKMLGFSDKEISIKLQIGYGTVRTHIDRAKLKLNCVSMTQLVSMVCITKQEGEQQK